MRSSPARPISPINTVSARMAISFQEDAMAAPRPGRRQVHQFGIPPTTLTKTSCSASLSPTRTREHRRDQQKPVEIHPVWRAAVHSRIGVGEVKPWISTRIGRVPSIATAIEEPGALIIRSSRKAFRWVGHLDQAGVPASRIRLPRKSRRSSVLHRAQ